MKLYIPFNMIIDTDYGAIRLFEQLYYIKKPEVNLISFLLNRKEINPIPEYAEKKGFKDIPDFVSETILIKGYPTVLKLSRTTDILAFVMNTYKLGLSNEVQITIGCDMQEEIDFLQNKLSKLDYSLDIKLNTKIDLNDYEYIMTKYINEVYVNDIIENKKLTAKRLYVSDHKFNVLEDDEGNKIIDIKYHIPLEANGIVLSLISTYNKKR